MFFLEQRKNVTKPIKGAAGLTNSSCVMPLNTFEWKQVAVCKAIEPLQDYVKKLPLNKRENYRIISNEPCQE